MSARRESGPGRADVVGFSLLHESSATCHHPFVALFKVRNRWLDLVGPIVLSSIIFTGVLVWFGDSLARAAGYSLTFNAVVTLLDGWRCRRRDAKRRRQPMVGA
jgi:hypothetical protein